MATYAHRIGAGFYVLWGILHAVSGVIMLNASFNQGGTAVLALVGTAVPAGDLPQNLTGIANGLLGQHSWNLLWLGIFAIVVAVLNWKNSRTGYWFNLVVVSGTDIGFIFGVLVPGYIGFVEGIVGPALWILAVIFSTIGIRLGKTTV